MRARVTAAVRWIGGRRLLLPLAARLICARIVRESGAFLARELLRPPGAWVYRLRASGVRVAIRHQGVDAATLAEVFYHRYYEPPADVAQVIGEMPETLDLGANIGLFGAFAIGRWPRARITAYEPDPLNAALHERTIEVNGLADRWSLQRAAAGASEGEVRFAAGLDVGSHVLDGSSEASGKTITVIQRDVLSQVAVAGLVKMDIEGGEWDILYDPRFVQSPPRVLVLEYHPARCPEREPRAAAERALKAAGLRTASIWHGDDGHGMLWGWRP